MKVKQVLVVEDSLSQLEHIFEVVRGAGYEGRAVTSINEAKAQLLTGSFSILLCDIHLTSSLEMNTFEGLKLLEHTFENFPEILSIAMSSDPKIETFQRALLSGAQHFIKKPILSAGEFAIGVEIARNRRVLERAARQTQNQPLISEALKRKCPDGLVIDEKCRKFAEKVASNRRISVILTGESGTGKEEIAKLIHRNRILHEGLVPLVSVNCANLSGELAASHLFGHKRGAFTGATETTIGYIGEANGGILFLDEIHALPVQCQQRLLRVLNDGTYERVGETRPLHSEFQLLCATTKDLDDEVESGRFLFDLHMRISGAELKLSPLRERKEDLGALVALFFAREGISVPSEEILRIAHRCEQYTWRGNIRQLFKVLQTLAVMTSCNDEPITAENLPVFRSMVEERPELSPYAVGFKGLPSDVSEKLVEYLSRDTPLEPAVDFFEKMKIQATLGRHDKIQDVVRILSIARSTLDAKRKKHSL